jgi:putative pyruvate formate lyase activating enzyme
VTATPYAPQVKQALDLARPKLHIPVVYNCGGYESVETIRALRGYVDVYLPDLKYLSGELAQRYSDAADYFEVATKAIKEMIDQTGGIEYDDEGLMQHGVIVRHLVLPGARKDSIGLLNWINENLPNGQYLLSLMSQYSPTTGLGNYPELNRRVTSLEYDTVVREALKLGLTNGFMQQRSSASEAYIPPFDLTGV